MIAACTCRARFRHLDVARAAPEFPSYRTMPFQKHSHTDSWAGWLLAGWRVCGCKTAIL
jgi:hypothetical protein